MAKSLAASIGDAKHFDSGRQLATWLGLVPWQQSSAGRTEADTWLKRLLSRRNNNVATLVLANKNARIVWTRCWPMKRLPAGLHAGVSRRVVDQPG